MKKILLSLALILSISYLASAQLNLIKDSNCEKQGVWLAAQTSSEQAIPFVFGSTANTLAGGEGGNLEVSFVPTAADAQIFIYQPVEVEAEKVYEFDCAFRDLSADLNNCWWMTFFWSGIEPADGTDIDEERFSQFNEWANKEPGFDGNLGTAFNLETNMVTFPESGTIYVGVCVGVCDVVGDFTFVFDNIQLVDPDGEPVGVNSISANNISLDCYPNPTDKYINFNYTLVENSKVEITLTNILGEKVATRTLGSKLEGTHTELIDCSNLARGLYYGTLTVNNLHTITKKIIVSK